MIERDLLMQWINDWDPVGLIMMSAPYDEYALEVDAILKGLVEGMCVDAIVKLVDDTFHHYFNNNDPNAQTYQSDPESLALLARKIHAFL